MNKINCAIFIVTFERDFVYLKWCLKSIAKFARGFSKLVILVPREQKEKCQELTWCGIDFPFQVFGGDEWPGMGMMWHEHQIMSADQWCPDADFICHMDADCAFTAPVTPETFFRDGKPILQYETFESIGKRHQAVLEWQRVTEACLPFPVRYETMRGHGMTFPWLLYSEARGQMVQKTRRPVEEYIKSVKQDFPNGFCEFVTLGNVAMEKMRDKIYPLDMAKKPNPDKSDFPIFQAWSHGNIDLPQDIWHEGVQRTITPIKFLEDLLLDKPTYKATPEETARMAE